MAPEFRDRLVSLTCIYWLFGRVGYLAICALRLGRSREIVVIEVGQDPNHLTMCSYQSTLTLYFHINERKHFNDSQSIQKYSQSTV